MQGSLLLLKVCEDCECQFVLFVIGAIAVSWVYSPIFKDKKIPLVLVFQVQATSLAPLVLHCFFKNYLFLIILDMNMWKSAFIIASGLVFYVD